MLQVSASYIIEKTWKYNKLSINRLNDGEGDARTIQHTLHWATNEKSYSTSFVKYLYMVCVNLTLTVQADLRSRNTAHGSHMFAEFTRTYTKDPPQHSALNYVIAHLRHYSSETYVSALIILKPDNRQYTVGSLHDDDMTVDDNTRRLLQHFLPAYDWSN